MTSTQPLRLPRVPGFRFRDGRALSLFLAALSGCGGDNSPPLASVKGSVSLDGKPVPHAVVRFQPEGKEGPSYAETGDDGQYELAFSRTKKGAVQGRHRVRVTTASLSTDSQGRETETPELIPAKYNAQSQLTFEVKPGENHYDIPLESTAKR